MWRGADTSASRHFPFPSILAVFPYCAFIVWSATHFFIHDAEEELRMVADMIGLGEEAGGCKLGGKIFQSSNSSN